MIDQNLTNLSKQVRLSNIKNPFCTGGSKKYLQKDTTGESVTSCKYEITRLID